MKNQWTTVSDDSGNTTPVEETPSPSEGKSSSSRNRRISIAFASMGVFLMLIGAAPFLFGDSNSYRYSAFLTPQEESEIMAEEGTESSSASNEETTSNSEEDFGESIAIDVDTDSESDGAMISDEETTAEEKTSPEEGTSDSSEEDPFPTLIQEPTTEDTSPKNDFEIVTEDDTDGFEIITEGPNEGVTVLTEKVDFPIETYEGITAGLEKGDTVNFGSAENFHSSAPVAPQTGTPLLPLLVFSGLAAFGIHRFGRKA